MAAQLDQFRAKRLDGRKRVLLVVIADGDTRLPVRLNALLKGRVVQLGVQAHPAVQPFELAGCGVELEGHFAPFHAYSVLPDMYNPTTRLTRLLAYGLAGGMRGQMFNPRASG